MVDLFIHQLFRAKRLKRVTLPNILPVKLSCSQGSDAGDTQSNASEVPDRLWISASSSDQITNRTIAKCCMFSLKEPTSFVTTDDTGYYNCISVPMIGVAIAIWLQQSSRGLIASDQHNLAHCPFGCDSNSNSGSCIL